MTHNLFVNYLEEVSAGLWHSQLHTVTKNPQTRKKHLCTAELSN